MFKGEKQIKTESIRKSKLGNKHKCTRIKTIYLFQCDSCGKEFAQQQGVKQRQVLRMDASSDTPISSL